METRVLMVSAKSVPSSVAGAISSDIREHGQAKVMAIGAGAVNQAVKAIAIARGIIAPTGKDLVASPGFEITKVDGESRTAIIFTVKTS